MDVKGRVLVVDDNRTSRLIAGKALEQIGCAWEEAEDGAAALARLDGGEVDLVLLDVEMPGMDGLEVMRRLRANPRHRDLPVLIVSGHDGGMDLVAQAIQLGAEDFLSKPFDAMLFKARVLSCIEKRKLRRVELDYLQEIGRLTEAAQVMEGGKFHPAALKLDTVAARPDALGRLAGIFMEMAHQVYDREIGLRNKIRTLKGGALLLVQGLLWGLVLPLSVLIYRENDLTLGVSFWTNIIAGLICCAWALSMGKSLRVTKAEMVFLLQWALIFGLSSVILFEAAGRVTGIALSIVMALQGFAVFAIAALKRIEAPSLRRFAGLGVGLIGVLALLLVRDPDAGVNNWAWLMVAMLVPLLYGMIDILLAVKHPATLDPVVSSGLVLLLSGLMILPVALLQGHWFTVGPGMATTDMLIALAGFCIGVCTVLYILLIAMAGAVFASQSAYAITVSGIAWSVVLLGEALTIWTLVTLVTIVVGLVLVGPKREAGDIEVEFHRRVRT
ncbi:response regulator [Tabrizicola sp. BL-A-41-H6]|uniref:response regulator n=1 Tax=Tabrizicola sp. BL-A-41-H6 TaxID=3421107 RepID=UPI003D66ABA0